MSDTLIITGKDFGDKMVRKSALKAIGKLTTEELQKLKQMTSDKGRKALINKWGLIKKFI